jgi:hypothetical protein
MALIGPSNCDDNRARRVKEIDAMWKELRIDIKRHMILRDSFDLLRESLSCYQNGACMAAAALCRASVESAVYLAITRYPKYQREWGIVRTRTSLDYIDEKWGRMLELAVAAGIVNKHTKAMIERIREAGNYALHRSQKVDWAVRRIATNPTIKIPVGEWYNEEKARVILRQTIAVLNRIGEWFAR